MSETEYETRLEAARIARDLLIAYMNNSAGHDLPNELDAKQLAVTWTLLFNAVFDQMGSKTGNT